MLAQVREQFCTVGFLALGLWQITELFLGSEETSDRIKAAAKVAVYVVLGLTTARFASGGGGSDSATASGATAGLLGSGVGKMALVVAGIAILAVGGYHVYKGATTKFVDIPVVESTPLRTAVL